MEETQVRCPQCGSTQIAPVRKDYDMGCGCLGLILFGWIGLLLGLLGGGNVEMVCANCGARWEPRADITGVPPAVWRPYFW